MKLTIGKKLLSGFMFALMLIIFEGALFNSLITSTEKSYQKLINENIENMLLANRLENDYLIQSNAVKNYLLTGDTIYLAQYKEHSQRVNALLGQMLMTYESEEDQANIKQLSALQLRHEELVYKSILFKKNGNEMGYTNILTTSAKTITNVVEGKIEALVKGQEEIVQLRSNEVSQAVNRIRETVLVVGVILLLIGTPLAIFLSRSISHPLYLLAQYTEKFFNPKKNFPSEFPKVKSSVYEVKQLYESIEMAFHEIRNHIHALDIEVQTDALTGIANRRTFDLLLNEQIYSSTPFALIMLDIDFFKKVNDTYGHLKGDDVLKFLAKTMKELSRKGDLCFRYGGEEFAIIVPYGDSETAFAIAERLRMKLERTPCCTGEAITISLGIAIFPEHGHTAKEIIAAADKALYKSKSGGRNQTSVFTKGTTLQTIS